MTHTPNLRYLWSKVTDAVYSLNHYRQWVLRGFATFNATEDEKLERTAQEAYNLYVSHGGKRKYPS